MACGDHDTADKIFSTHRVGNAGRSCHMKKVSVRPRRGKPRNKSVLEHIAASSCIFSDYNFRLMFSSIIPSYITSHHKRMIYCQLNVCFSTKTVCSKIFSHDASPPLIYKDFPDILPLLQASQRQRPQKPYPPDMLRRTRCLSFPERLPWLYFL